MTAWHGDLDAFEERCGPCAAVVHLDAPRETLSRRLRDRHAAAAATDHQAQHDTAEAVERRLRGFELQEKELVGKLKARGGAVSTVDGSRDAEEVFGDVCEIVDQALKNWGV